MLNLDVIPVLQVEFQNYNIVFRVFNHHTYFKVKKHNWQIVLTPFLITMWFCFVEYRDQSLEQETASV